MNKLLDLLKARWFISLLGVIALSALFWWAGPLVAFGDQMPLKAPGVRVLLIIICFIVWAIIFGARSQKANSNNTKLADAIVGVADAQLPDNSALHTRFSEALETLRTTRGRGKRGKQHLYELPWYIMIGPPGSGKTTALVNSGLRFPLEQQWGRGSLKGVAGTRHCDWWFTEEAVLIDTAGRYTTQDSHRAVDAAEWGGFLQLLKKHRRRRPINGVMVAISLSDVVNLPESELMSNVRAIRARLQELTGQLGLRFPVYLLFTKCDLIPGFDDFFAGLGKDDRAQVWGFTAGPDNQAQSLDNWASGESFALIKRLREHLLEKIHWERDVQRRASLVAFPNHMEHSLPRVVSFVCETFGISRYQDSGFLRGVYFTSGTQLANPLQRLTGAPAAAQGRSYFLQNLLKKVIFPEADLVGANRKFERQIRMAQGLAYISAIVAVVGASLLWSTSFGRNQLLLQTVEERLEHYLQIRTQYSDEHHALNVVAPLTALDAVANVFDDAGFSWLTGFGLSKSGWIIDAVEQRYHQDLQNEVKQSFINYLLQRLRETRQQPDQLFRTLKAYLMWGDAAHFDKRYLAEWLQMDWRNRWHQQPSDLKSLKFHLDNLLDLPLMPFSLDKNTVSASRDLLRRVPPEQQIYMKIKAYADAYYTRPLAIEEAVGSEFSQAFDSNIVSIPMLYTVEGYLKVYKSERDRLLEETSDDNWVVGTHLGDLSDEDLATVQAKLEKRYLSDYIITWNDFLNQLRLHSTQNLQELVAILQTLVSGNSPLRGLLELTDTHTRLAEAGISKEALDSQLKLSEKAAGLADPKAGHMARIATMAARSHWAKLPENPASLVDRQFEPLQRVLDGPQGQASELDRLQNAIEQLQVYMEGMANSGSSSESAFGQTLGRMDGGMNDPLGKLKVMARRLPDPLNRWMDDLVYRAWDQVAGGAYAHIATAYRQQVLPVYDASLAGRYPIDPRSKLDVNLDDFTEFFKPGGVEDTFFKQYLQPFVDTKQTPWSTKSVDGRSVGILPSSLVQFQRAEQIRRYYFGEGKELGVDFSVRPVSLDASSSRFELALLGEKITYRHGPTPLIPLHWPANLDGDISIQFEDYYGLRGGDSWQGAWALFRFLKAHPLKRVNQRETYEVSVKREGRQASFAIVAKRADNPFGQDVLSNFSMPKSL